MKKRFFGLLLICLTATGCTTSVRTDPVHGKLVGIWKLEIAAYVIRYDDEFRRLVIVPCVPENRIHLPNWQWEYEGNAIGRKGNGKIIVGALERGTFLEIIDILKVTHPTMGVSYHPVLIPMGGNALSGKKLDGDLLYRDFYEHGILDPKLAQPKR